MEMRAYKLKLDLDYKREATKKRKSQVKKMITSKGGGGIYSQKCRVQGQGG